MASPILNVNVIADTKKFSSGMRDATSITEKFETGLKRFGIAAGVAFAAATAGVIALGVSSVKAGSQLEQSIGGTEAVFKEYAGVVGKYSKEAADSLGLSENSYRELATVIGSQLKNTGTAFDILADKTNGLITLAADLAATFGGTTLEAAQAISAALRGELDPIERYGITLKAATVEAKALAMSGKDVASSLTLQEKSAATQAIIFEQAASSLGMFAAESDTLAGQTQRLNAQLENMKATIGTALVPVLAEVMPVLRDFIDELVVSPAFNEFLDAFAQALGDILMALLPLLPPLVSIIGDLLPPFVELFAALTPIIAKLVEAFMPLVEGIMPLLVELVDLVIPLVDVFVDLLIPLIPIITEIVTAFIPLVEEILPLLTDLIRLLVPAMQAFAVSISAIVKNVIQPFASALADVVGWVGQLFGFSGKTVSAPGLTANRPKLAEGGIVMPRPGGVPVTVAEAGQAEAIVPLDKLGSLGGGMKVTINGNVGWSPEDMANIILKKQRQAMALAGLNSIVGVR
jgi:phage-related protein